MTMTAADHIREIMHPETRKLWRNYGCTVRRRFEAWVTPQELARIDAGVCAGTIEVREEKQRGWILHAWREVVSAAS